MYLDIILPALLPDSMLMTSCHVTMVIDLFIIQEKQKQKTKKENIKKNR